MEEEVRLREEQRRREEEEREEAERRAREIKEREEQERENGSINSRNAMFDNFCHPCFRSRDLLIRKRGEY